MNTQNFDLSSPNLMLAKQVVAAIQAQGVEDAFTAYNAAVQAIIPKNDHLRYWETFNFGYAAFLQTPEL